MVFTVNNSVEERKAKEDAFKIYRLMRLIRRTEEILMFEYRRANEMKCPMHFCVGQESMPAALSTVLRKADNLVTHYRSHGYYLAKGAPLEDMIAEFYGKATGANSGLAGSMELGHHECNFYSGAIVGGPVMIALGGAFAQKYQGLDDISVAVQGDGAMDEGVTYEVMNIAVLHQLPLLIVCENNGYAAHTPLAKHSGSKRMSDRARAFGMTAYDFDGNQPLDLAKHLSEITSGIRVGGGPVFMEIDTYRHCAHVGPDSDDEMEYRTPDEVARWIANDPIAKLRGHLMEVGVDRKAVEIAEAEIEDEVQSAVAAARMAPFPALDWALHTVTANTYSKAILPFVKDAVQAFDGHQTEAKLAPY